MTKTSATLFLPFNAHSHPVRYCHLYEHSQPGLKTLPAPQAITDPKQITSKPNANVEQNQQSLSIERLYMTRSVGATAWSPDGKTIAFVSNISGRNNIWLVPAEGGWPTQLTVSDQRQTSPAWSPDGKWIAYISDYDGDEQWDIFFVSPKTGQVVNITNTREISEESPTWSPRRPLSRLHGETQDFVGVRNRYLRHPDARYQAPDHRHAQRQDELSIPSGPTTANGSPIPSTRPRAQTPISSSPKSRPAKAPCSRRTRAKQLYAANDFSPDGKRLLITSNAGNGYDNVGLLDIATKKIDWLTQDKWEIEGGNFSPDGKSVTWTANVDGNTDIYVHDLASGKTTSLPLPKGVNRSRRRGLRLHPRWRTPALLPQRPDIAQRCLGLFRGRRQVAADHEFAGGRRALRGHGRAVSGALSQPRRQVDHLRLRLRALQHGAQRPERSCRLRARRPDRRRA